MELKIKQRISLSAYFFLSGICFATWASRIPTIKTFYDLNEAELGNLLFIMPISSLIGLPFSGWLVSKFNSRNPLIIAFILYSLSLIFIGYSSSIFFLSVSLFLFSFSMRIINIAINTQSIALQNTFEKKIIGSFHGLWSLGGLIGVGYSTLLLKFDVAMKDHLLSIAVFSFLVALIAYQFLMKNDKPTSGNKLIIGKPDTFILLLGIMVFLAAVCEGGMFDWSGVYFKEVIKEDVFTLGYFIFMVFMAFSRFISDKIIDSIGMKKAYIISSLFISSGISMVIIFPYFWPAIVGFSFVGIGVAAIIPMTYALAGKSKKYSAGMVVSIITTYGIVGMLLGPPLVGYLAHLFNLKTAFILFLISGLLLIPISQLFFKTQKDMMK
ncbi:MFS transporter [Lutibacter sp.]|uniref:MFS transporter n=1 Tax=Lutibacter sp. TaxID=1925666 RepID=UPI001A2D6501|nr:MFS transporter [Lutibacter sp.]MBI9042402.1 MFS transporter [Lutibacter sp.]